MRLSYDGAGYHGWQVQARDTTVCGTLESAVSKICGETVQITGCGRTDAGVHALRYCANFRTESTIPADRLPLAVNTQLPPDIVVQAAIDAPEEFNAVLSCIKKEYVYRLADARARDPFRAGRVYFYPREIDLDAVRIAASRFVGTHDFAAVRSVGTVTKTTVRTIHWCEAEREDGETIFRICADGFLYNMARAIVGTLLYVSEGKIRPDAIGDLLNSRDRRLAGPTVPGHGLYLARLWYEGDAGVLMGDNEHA